ncbi:MAG: T9SS type A sorting domain-containing protein, partial [Bacteroidales bacterium]
PVSASDLGSDYNVLVFDSFEPSNTSEYASLSFHPIPVITEEPASQAVCTAGNSASFSVTATGAGLTYQWRKGTVTLTNGGNISGATSAILTIDPAVIADAAANYNVVIAGECAPNDTSANASLVVNQKPTTPTVTVTHPSCSEPTGTITVTSTLAGLSFSIDGTDYTNTSGMFTSLAAGEYEVTAKSADGCVSAGTSVTLECVTGVFTLSNVNAIAVNIYPNPFTTSLYIAIDDVSQINNCELKIYSVLGNEVISTTVTKQLSTIETSNLPCGIYFYKVIDKGILIQSGKLISQEN